MNFLNRKNFNLKKFVLINSVIVFLLAFITHNLYTWIPSFITTMFPVNESLYEHLKMVFITPILYGIVLYFIAYNRKITYWLIF